MSEKEEKISTNRKILFCLSGIQNSGKTSTLKMLYDKFKILPNFKSLKFLANKPDFSDEFIIAVNNNNFRIGINTAGDVPSDITNTLNNFKNCDHIICASRSRGATKDVVEKFAKNNGFTPKFITKSHFETTPINKTEYDKLNKYLANGLHTLFTDYLNGGI